MTQQPDPTNRLRSVELAADRLASLKDASSIIIKSRQNIRMPKGKRGTLQMAVDLVQASGLPADQKGKIVSYYEKLRTQFFDVRNISLANWGLGPEMSTLVGAIDALVEESVPISESRSSQEQLIGELRAIAKSTHSIIDPARLDQLLGATTVVEYNQALKEATQDYREERSSIELEISEARARAERRSENDQLKVELQKKNGENAELRRSRDKTQNELAAKEAELEGKNQALEDEKARYGILMSEKGQVSEELRGVRVELGKVRDERDGARANFERRKNYWNRRERNIRMGLSRVQAERNELRRERDGLKTALDRSKEAVRNRQSDVDGLSIQVATKKAEIAAVQARQESLTADLESTGRALEAIQSENGRAFTRWENLFHILRDKLGMAENEKDTAIARANEAERKLSKLRGEESALRAELLELQKSERVSGLELKKAQAELQKEKESKARMEKQKESAEESAARLSARFVERVESLRVMRGHRDKLAGEVQKLTHRISDLEESESNLKASLEEKDQEIGRLTTENDDLREKWLQKQVALDRAREERDENASQRDRAREELEAERVRNRELSGQLQEARAKLERTIEERDQVVEIQDEVLKLLHEAQQMIAKLKEERDQGIAENVRLGLELQVLHKELSQLASRFNLLTEDRDAARKELSETERVLKELREVKEDKLEEALRKMIEWKDKVEHLEAQNGGSDELPEIAPSLLAEKNQKIDELNAEVLSLTENIKELQGTLELKARYQEGLLEENSALRGHEIELTRLRGLLAKRATELAKVITERDDLKKQLNNENSSTVERPHTEMQQDVDLQVANQWIDYLTEQLNISQGLAEKLACLVFYHKSTLEVLAEKDEEVEIAESKLASQAKKLDNQATELSEAEGMIAWLEKEADLLRDLLREKDEEIEGIGNDKLEVVKRLHAALSKSDEESNSMPKVGQMRKLANPYVANVNSAVIKAGVDKEDERKDRIMANPKKSELQHQLFNWLKAGDMNKVTEFAHRGADLNLSHIQISEDTPLTYLIRTMNPKDHEFNDVIRLMDLGAKANVANENGELPLEVAARFGNPDLLVHLLEVGGAKVDDAIGARLLENAKKNPANYKFLTKRFSTARK